MKVDPLGDRVKLYEEQANSQVFPEGSFVLARVDGRAFHTYTKGLRKPMDIDLQNAMISATQVVAEQLKSVLAYVQSDEATFCWRSTLTNPLPFNGRVQKLCSLIAATFTGGFIHNMPGSWLDERGVPAFDCRIWSVPGYFDQYEAFLWREKDAIKNAVSSAASTIATPRELKDMKHKARLELLKERGFDFESLPREFRHGAYVRRMIRLEELPEETRLKIPESKRPLPGVKFERSDVRVDHQLTSVRQIDNLEAFFAHGAQPSLRGLQTV